MSFGSCRKRCEATHKVVDMCVALQGGLVWVHGEKLPVTAAVVVVVVATVGVIVVCRRCGIYNAARAGTFIYPLHHTLSYPLPPHTCLIHIHPLPHTHSQETALHTRHNRKTLWLSRLTAVPEASPQTHSSSSTMT